MAKHSNFTTIADSDWEPAHREYLKSIVRRLDRIFQRQLSMHECVILNAILTVHEFTLQDGFVINGDDDDSCLGNREIATVVGCLHEGPGRHDAQWWYMELAAGGHPTTTQQQHQLLGEMVSHPSVSQVR